MPKMRKFEIDEVNCPESFVTVSIRGDLIGTVAKCLRNCSEQRAHCNAARNLGEQLARAGDMIYRQIPAMDHLDIADVVVDHEGLEHDNVETRVA